MSNFAAALKAEAKRVIRFWQRYDHEQRSLLASGPTYAGIYEGMNPASKQAYIVWNEARTEGYVTFDKQVAYEARKGAESNCFDSNGTQMHLAQAFCEVTGIQNCTVQKIEIASVFDPEDFHRS